MSKVAVNVFHKGGRCVTSSTDIAEKFCKSHKHVLDAVRNLDCSEEFSRTNFRPSHYRKRGKKYPCYDITRDGFSFLVMGFTGKESAIWKEKYINAFNKMEQAIQHKQEPLHIQTRTDGKRIRRGQTDVIQAFIEYAKENGSDRADYYYMAFTKMQNAALFIADKAKSENMRDLLNTEQLFQIGIADQLVAQVIRDGIKTDIPYKDIFQAAKRKVIAFAELVGVSEVPSLGLLGHNSQHVLEEEEGAATPPSDDN